MAYRYIAVLSLPLMLSGCTVTPVPEHVVGYDTNDVVRYIRCEAADAIRKGYQIFEQTPAHAGIKTIKTADFDKASIEFDFTFEMAGLEKGGAGMDVLSTLSRGTVVLNLGAGGELKREQNRTFRIADTFKSLLAAQCKDRLHASSSWRYPIAGKIGLEEVVTTFLKLYGHNNLADLDNKKRPTMTSTLIFTTTVDVSAAITVELNKLGSRSLEITKAVGTGIISQRVDKHQVMVAISMDKLSPVASGSPNKKRPTIRRPRGTAGPILNPLVDDQTADSPSGSASRAINQQKFLDALRTRR